MPPVWRRCSSVTCARHAPSSRLASWAPHRPRRTSQFATRPLATPGRRARSARRCAVRSGCREYRGPATRSPTVGARVIDADARFVRQVRAPAGRLRLPRQIGDELLPGVEQFPLVDDVVAVEDGAALVAETASVRRQAPRQRCLNPGFSERIGNSRRTGAPAASAGRRPDIAAR